MTNLKKLRDAQCAKIAVVVGAGIHGYTFTINNDHFQGILEDFTNGQYLKGALKTTVPILLPYCVSLYSRIKAKNEVQGKINNLEETIRQLREK